MLSECVFFKKCGRGDEKEPFFVPPITKDNFEICEKITIIDLNVN